MAVREAARIVAAETELKAIEPLAREIADRVLAELRLEIEGLADDPFMEALRRARTSPFVTLAICPEIDTISDFVERRVERLRARAGSYLSAIQQETERAAILREITPLLVGRYARQLRALGGDCLG